MALSIGCGRVKVATAPNGVLQITCGKGMKDCVTRAAKACGEDGYVIVSGKTTTKLLSGPSSSYRKLSEVAELEVICGSESPLPKTEVVYKLPPRQDEPLQPAPAPAPAAQACIPGATQQCVGPGACAGGQVCLASGQGFSACDCGTEKSAPAPSDKPPQATSPSTVGDPKKPAPNPDTPPPSGVPAPTPLSD